MNGHRQFSRNWDEFRWERELRRDERRINCYFREMPCCLDLPGEEEMLLQDLACRSDLMPAAGTNQIHPWSYLDSDFDGEDEEENTTVPPRREGESLIQSLDALAVRWNIFCAGSLHQNLEYAGLGIACAYAKLLARTADFLDAPADEPALKRCLGKRALNDLNAVSCALTEIARLQPSAAGFCQLQHGRLIALREQLFDRLSKCSSKS